MKNIGAGSVQGEDFKTVGPGGAQRSKLDRRAGRRLKAQCRFSQSRSLPQLLWRASTPNYEGGKRKKSFTADAKPSSILLLVNFNHIFPITRSSFFFLGVTVPTRSKSRVGRQLQLKKRNMRKYFPFPNAAGAHLNAHIRTSQSQAGNKQRGNNIRTFSAAFSHVYGLEFPKNQQSHAPITHLPTPS